MEFRLLYQGKLPAASQNNTRARDKHRIRRDLSPQLETLWATHPRLKDQLAATGYSGQRSGGINFLFGPPERFSRCNREFLPLMTRNNGVGCALDILFLRRDAPGSVLRTGGDLDNRMKVLLDALKMPREDSEVSADPADDPKPFYCLLEDDSLITDLRVNTDRLLVPRKDDEYENDVSLIVRVRSVVLDPTNLLAVTF